MTVDCGEVHQVPFSLQKHNGNSVGVQLTIEIKKHKSSVVSFIRMCTQSHLIVLLCLYHSVLGFY